MRVSLTLTASCTIFWQTTACSSVQATALSALRPLLASVAAFDEQGAPSRLIVEVANCVTALARFPELRVGGGCTVVLRWLCLACL